MKKATLFVMLAVLCCAMVFANGSQEQKATQTYVLSLGGTTGTFYQLGTAVSDYINTNYPTVMGLLPSTSAGGVENVRNVANGDAAFGCAFPKDVVNAYTGVSTGGKALNNLRYVGVAQKPNACAIVVLKDSGINSIYDLKGKTVAPGAPGSSAYDMFTEFAAHLGILDSIKIVNFGSEEIPGKMVDGVVDACVVMTMAETAASRISSISSLKPIRIIDVADAVKDSKFLDAASYYSTVTLPGGQYAGQDTPVVCFSAYPVWVTSTDIPEEIVYQFLNLSYSKEGVEYINNLIKGQGHDTPNQLETVFPVPLHAGAEKYWKENGYANGMPEPFVK